MTPNPEPNRAAAVLGDPFVVAQEASRCLSLPLYWLTHPKQRARRGVPFYRIGGLVRFRLCELENWMHRASTSVDPKTDGGTDA